ncbi:MAG: hypothetical protein ACOYOA_15085 [Saprospiraceae bacterium]
MKIFGFPFAIVLTLLLFSGWSCSGNLEGIDMIYRQDFPREIPVGASTLFSHNFTIEKIGTNATTFYKNNNLTEFDIKRIVPKFARISARFGNGDFVFVNRVFVYIYPVGQPDKKMEVFYRDDIPVNTGNVLNLNPGIADVKSIMNGQTYTMEIRLDLRGQPGQNIEALIDYSFFAVTQD